MKHKNILPAILTNIKNVVIFIQDKVRIFYFNGGIVKRAGVIFAAVVCFVFLGFTIFAADLYVDSSGLGVPHYPTLASAYAAAVSGADIIHINQNISENINFAKAVTLTTDVPGTVWDSLNDTNSTINFGAISAPFYIWNLTIDHSSGPNNFTVREANATGPNVNFENCVIQKTGQTGTIIGFVSYTNSGKFNVRRSVIIGNASETGINSDGASTGNPCAYLENVIIRGCQTGVSSQSVNNPIRFALMNCTLFGNTTAIQGNGSNAVASFVTNTLFLDNTTDVNNSRPAMFSYDVLTGIVCSNCKYNPVDTTEVVDPVSNPPDLHLANTSLLATDGGTAAGAPLVDFDNKLRPSGSAFDVGVYEWGTPPTITFTITVTPTFTVTQTYSETPTFTPTCTITETSTVTPTITETDTDTATPTFTETPTFTDTDTVTSTYTITETSSDTPEDTQTYTETSTPTVTETLTQTATYTDTPEDTATYTSSPTPSITESPEDTLTYTATATSTAEDTFTITPTVTDTPVDTMTYTDSPTPTITLTSSWTPTYTDTPEDTQTFTVTATSTAEDTFTITPTATDTPVDTMTYTDSPTPTITATSSETGTYTDTPEDTATFTVTQTPTPGDTFTVTPTSTDTFQDTQTYTDTPTLTMTATPADTGTFTETSTPTATGTAADTFTATATYSPTPTLTGTATNTVTPTSSWTPQNTATFTPSVTRTGTPTMTQTSTSEATATNTPTVTPTASSVKSWTLYPNPVNPYNGDLKVATEYDLAVSETKLLVFTRGMRKVREISMGASAPGETVKTVAGPNLQGLARDVYYTVVVAKDSAGSEHRSSIQELFIVY
jgi:hypothetical protein